MASLKALVLCLLLSTVVARPIANTPANDDNTVVDGSDPEQHMSFLSTTPEYPYTQGVYRFDVFPTGPAQAAAQLEFKPSLQKSTLSSWVASTVIRPLKNTLITLETWLDPPQDNLEQIPRNTPIDFYVPSPEATQQSPQDPKSSTLKIDELSDVPKLVTPPLQEQPEIPNVVPASEKSIPSSVSTETIPISESQTIDTPILTNNIEKEPLSPINRKIHIKIPINKISQVNPAKIDVLPNTNAAFKLYDPYQRPNTFESARHDTHLQQPSILVLRKPWTPRSNDDIIPSELLTRVRTPK